MREAKTSKNEMRPVGLLKVLGTISGPWAAVMFAGTRSFSKVRAGSTDTNDQAPYQTDDFFSAVWTQTTSALHALSMSAS
jgi:hypothetical protein